jgi:hypothetical protein
LTENNDSLGGAVSFHGDMGGLYGISYLLVQPTDAEIYNDPVLRDRAYSSYLHNFFLPEIIRQSSQTEVLHEEFVNEGADRELLAVINIPGGSHLMDGISGRRFDSTRGLLIFKALGALYMLQYELSDPVFRDADYPINDVTLERARDSLHRFKETVEFR